MDEKPEKVVLQVEWIVTEELQDEALSRLQAVIADPSEDQQRHTITSSRLQ